jgi:UDP-3-O-acyl-N-acetylglucosamine deacetylase
MELRGKHLFFMHKALDLIPDLKLWRATHITNMRNQGLGADREQKTLRAL